MACRVWLADPAEFEAQPAGFGKRPGPPTGEERDLAASAAALWNALASDARRYADDPGAGPLTARVLGEGPPAPRRRRVLRRAREDAREGVVRWRHCAAAAAAAAAESERRRRRPVRRLRCWSVARCCARVADLVCCGAEEEPQFRTKAMECLAKATAACATTRRAPRGQRASAAAPVLGAESPAAARAWKVAFDALPGELDVYERDVVALSLAPTAAPARRRAPRRVPAALPQSYEDLLTHRAEFLPMDKVERIVEGGALDALVRRRPARRRRNADAEPARGPSARPTTRSCILLAARGAYIERGHVNELVPWLDSGDKADVLDAKGSELGRCSIWLIFDERSSRNAAAAARRAHFVAPRATVALLIFAEGRGGENAWLADICAHGGVPRLLDIVRKDFLLSLRATRRTQRRAMHLLRLAAKSAIGRAAAGAGRRRRALVTTNVDEDALLEHLDIIQDAAAARYAAYERRR
ncbi:hypothetical protein JL720_5743 [Aureococcus anophagefferens]|nr:hypothetical protein JL720_5743 [Aureococcus anophagefferens]